MGSKKLDMIGSKLEKSKIKTDEILADFRAELNKVSLIYNVVVEGSHTNETSRHHHHWKKFWDMHEVWFRCTVIEFKT
jgi:hypothetical protein